MPKQSYYELMFNFKLIAMLWDSSHGLIAGCHIVVLVF